MSNYDYMHSMYPSSTPTATVVPPLQDSHCRCEVKQQPKEVLVTIEGKEKSRKPIDPPPVVQLMVHENVDRTSQFLQNPYIFAVANLLKADSNETYNETGDNTMIGTLVSSLHRLKDTNNKDGGYFIFGDISVKIQGTFKLRFTVYELHPDGYFVCIGATNSAAFKSVASKDFKGLEESTSISRAFSDQGVRLRLRKEPKSMPKRKREREYSEEEPADALAQHAPSTPSKRLKAESDVQDSYSRSPNDSTAVYAQPYTTPTRYNTTSLSTTGFSPTNFGASGYDSMSRLSTMQTSSNNYSYSSYGVGNTFPSLSSAVTQPYPARGSMMPTAYTSSPSYQAPSMNTGSLYHAVPRSQPQSIHQPQQQQHTMSMSSPGYPVSQSGFNGLAMDPYLTGRTYPSDST